VKAARRLDRGRPGGHGRTDASRGQRPRRPKGCHDPTRTATRHGADDGTVTLGGRRLLIRRPRVRSIGEDEHEIPLESYTTFASTDLLVDHIVAGMLAGLSTRRYEHGLEPVGERVAEQAKGTSKSASVAGSSRPPRRSWLSCWPVRSMTGGG
jgi:hypothetical protein